MSAEENQINIDLSRRSSTETDSRSELERQCDEFDKDFDFSKAMRLIQVLKKERDSWRDTALANEKECPWPEDVWPMTEEQYVKAVPDPDLRTAISGFLMRRGWQVAEKWRKEAVRLMAEGLAK